MIVSDMLWYGLGIALRASTTDELAMNTFGMARRRFFFRLQVRGGENQATKLRRRFPLFPFRSGDQRGLRWLLYIFQVSFSSLGLPSVAWVDVKIIYNVQAQFLKKDQYSNSMVRRRSSKSRRPIHLKFSILKRGNATTIDTPQPHACNGIWMGTWCMCQCQRWSRTTDHQSLAPSASSPIPSLQICAYTSISHIYTLHQAGIVLTAKTLQRITIEKPPR